jgi:hypothetical protein
MPIAPLAAALVGLAAAQTGSSMMSHPTDFQATKILCRPDANATISSGPVCRGGGASRLEVQPVCFCNGTDIKVEEKACWPDGRPAIFPAHHRVTVQEDSKLVSCRDIHRHDR